jgi:hypothetical protein
VEERAAVTELTSSVPGRTRGDAAAVGAGGADDGLPARQALQITAAAPDPALLDLPWHLPLEEWPARYLAALPRGLSRHVVRFVRVSGRVLAVKEIAQELAAREYVLLRLLQRLGLPVVELPSGAGHDAAVLAAAGVPVAMLFVRSLNGGVSHSPEELSSEEDIELAVDVLTGSLRALTG